MRTSEGCNVLVVGGGVIGVCVAYYCATAGANVVVVEQDAICSGCSYGNAGLIVPSYSTPLSAPGVFGKALLWLFDPESPFYIKPRFDADLLRWLALFAARCNQSAMRNAIPRLRDLARASIALYRELLSASEFDCGYDQRGLLILCSTARGLQEGRAQSSLLREFGIASEEMNADATREIVPASKQDVAGGFYYPEDSHLVPSDFVRGLAKRAESLGVKFCSSTRVDSFELSEGAISAVLTSSGTFQASEIVIASGAWSAALLRGLKVRLPVEPAKGYSVTVAEPSHMKLQVPLLLHETKVAVTPMAGLIRFAGTLELAGFDTSINQRRLESLLRNSQRYLSGIENVGHVESWSGLRPCTPDGLPVLGRLGQLKNVVVATGHGMLGMTLGPITGKLVSEIISHGTATLDLAPFAPERFA